MILPPLYKYLDVQGAKLTLRNGTFKHSKPSKFEDTEDMTIKSIFPEETETALKKLATGFTEVILQHLNDQPTCSSLMKERIELIQNIYRNNSNAADFVSAELSKQDVGSIYDVDHMRKVAINFIQEINTFMQGYRIFCVTIHKHSEKMWSVYGEYHQGVVLRIEPNLAKDSKFQLFSPVKYREMRPPLYESTMNFLADSLFGDREARIRGIMEKIVYSKTFKWQHEGEYRLAIPLRKGEPSWEILPYYPEEVSELYIGHAMEEQHKADIIVMAKSLNPQIKIFG